MPDYKGDGNCDDENNNKGCAYDGGDCCPKTEASGEVNKKYCQKVGRRWSLATKLRTFIFGGTDVTFIILVRVLVIFHEVAFPKNFSD